MKTENRKPKTNDRIYLTGFMACGKSTVGPLLAERLGWGFLDLDEEVAAHARKTVPAIFEEDGEAAFRRREAEALRTTIGRERVVVALGGGALTDEANLRWALDHGLVVYLKVSSGELTRRLQAEANTRPLLLDEAGQALAAKALGERVAHLLERRAPFYEQAHITVAADGPPEAVAADAARQTAACGFA